MGYKILRNRSTVSSKVALGTPTAGKLLYVNILEIEEVEKTEIHTEIPISVLFRTAITPSL